MADNVACYLCVLYHPRQNKYTHDWYHTWDFIGGSPSWPIILDRTSLQEWMTVCTVTAVWRGQHTSIGRVCHLLPGQEIPFLWCSPFPASHVEGTKCKCASVPSRGQRGKGKSPSTETPLGQGILKTGGRQVSQLILPRSFPKMHFPDRIESCNRNRSVTLVASPNQQGWVGNDGVTGNK